MKILQIIYSLSSGGAERFVVDLSNELASFGNDVTICILLDDSLDNNDFYKKYIRQEVSFRSLKIPKGLRPSNIYKLHKIILELSPDIVHCHLNLVNYIFPLTFLFPKISFFHTIHNQASKEVKSKLEYFVRRWFYKRQKVKTITISKETSKSYLDYYKFSSYNEIINGRSLPITTTALPKLLEQVKEDAELNFLHIGRFSKQKNQFMLINVFNRIKESGYNISLSIIGSGFEKAEAKKLKSIAGNHIKFLGEKHNIADYLFASDAFCLSSIHEGMPITLIEALACGCVPVCTPADGINDMIIDEKTGFLSKSFSENDYYQTVIKFIQNRNKLNKDHLIQSFKSNYHINICARNYANSYNNSRLMIR